MLSNLFFDSLILAYLTGITGLALMIAIDNIYSFTLRNGSSHLHSGQSFLTGLIIGSFFLEAEMPFLFLAAIKLIINMFQLYKTRNHILVFNLRFFRTAILALLSVFILSGNEVWTGTGTAIFLAGELIDRIVFYFDFQPLNIKDTLRKIPDDKKTD